MLVLIFMCFESLVTGIFHFSYLLRLVRGPECHIWPNSQIILCQPFTANVLCFFHCEKYLILCRSDVAFVAIWADLTPVTTHAGAKMT